MCLYGRVVFTCAHERWGLCVKKCPTSEAFAAKESDHDCLVKNPHVPTSPRLQKKCNRCIAMENKLGKARKSIEDVKETLRRIEEKKAKIEEKKKTEEKKKMEEQKMEESQAEPVVELDPGLGVISEEDETEESEMGDSSWASGSCTS
ncbi:hypothetical protein NW752_010157 [Fusarium irregulare]|uniref:Uncharacterized protein n=1 Tax=Fusarium irregulare TaxID=2494466 RepID=A0A9W8PJ89_9HYPO|nr:hypothetical protein LB507_000392 [Fusarium sp. FIESC RH6]KAJ4008277.1 hypothetical protein NW752_010157 [Fusarium irregulare]KAJ4008548.1 hypothetical protein NW766_009542 [Fusarium irregulare]